jgi:hypothetical protein
LDIAVFDVDTCEPITDAWVEIWRKYNLTIITADGWYRIGG